MVLKFIIPSLLLLTMMQAKAQNRARDFGIQIGVMEPGYYNNITDVAGVKVAHVTKIKGEDIRTGVTAILPHEGNLFQEKVPAAVFVGNGFGKLAGSTQIEELGNLESPIVLTNTLNVATGLQGIITYTLSQAGNEAVQSVNAVVGETNDGYLNDIRGQHVSIEDVIAAIQNAKSGMVEEGNVGAGTGTVAFGFKGGIGSSSRKLPENLGGFHVGVLVQSNFGGVLQIDGVPIGKLLGQYSFKNQLESADGSCMIIVATDAPVDERNLKRMAQRAMMGLAKTGGIASNGSGDYVIAFSTYEKNRVKHNEKSLNLEERSLLRNDDMSPLFLATIEATEEAIINSLFAAKTMTGKEGRTVQALPLDEVIQMMKNHNRIP
ncbi:DmpA family aminopeptidase [Cecembia lonarensis]|uniref:L-aminopeptidase/D-esterase n=1 Tax=Cecembia lonarensis (strain CCUG 58316 / KCTC 22772 / LW9) TaxID=1225176 RepID=K1LKC3_CECL9|nr:P1 family peptidase [Cecembia lonarensis]EKB50758.1 L-aminopeptidase/D-esterase [Cecembia lonarensis LW9]